MKKSILHGSFVTLTVTAIILAGLWQTASSFSVKTAEDFWQQIGLSQVQGNENIKTSFVYNYANIYGAKNAKNIALNKRAEVAKSILVYTKKFVTTPEFKNFYTAERNQSKPAEPPKNPRTKEQVRKTMIEDLEKAIREIEKAMPGLPAESKKELQKSIDESKKMIEDYKQPDNEVIETMYQAEVSTHAYETEQFKEEMGKWSTRFPEDSRLLVKDRLQRYLDMGLTVDFEAELELKNGKKRFVNPEYESKPSEWKMIFRAGKEVYATTKQFVDEWIAEFK